MRDLSLNILDIVRNSLEAGASRILVKLEETRDMRILTVEDNGCGMPEEMLARVTDPFFTTRETRRTGLGIPLLKMAAERTGGTFSITSRYGPGKEESGTCVRASFCLDSVDSIPLGDVIATLCTLIQGCEENKTQITFYHRMPQGEVSLDTVPIRRILGPEVPVSCPAVLQWVRQELTEQYQALNVCDGIT